MNKTSFIIEFDEVSKTQEEKLTEFMEKTGIKFQVLESDNDLKKYKKYKEVTITITLEEYKELLIIKGKYEELKSTNTSFPINRKIIANNDKPIIEYL